jgi:Mn-dependent DtxR family transcriptional regulator
MKRNKRVEDYMKIIYRHREKDFARSVDIARELGVSKPTVSVALKKMEASGLIFFHQDMGIGLTPEGERIAREVTERYNALYGLLTDLGVDDETAQDDACRMEHGISDRSLSALIELRQKLSQNTEKF